MIDYMVPLERVCLKKEIIVDTSGPFQTENEFLFNFMQDVLYVSACDPYFIPGEIEMIHFDSTNRKARSKLKGEEFDLKRHGGYGTEVKGSYRRRLKGTLIPLTKFMIMTNGIRVL